MSFIRQRKKNIFRAGLAGVTTGIAIVILLIVSCFLLIHNHFSLKRTEDKKQDMIEFYKLAVDKSAGDVLVEEDLVAHKRKKGNEHNESVKKEELIGKRLSFSLSAGTILTKVHIWEKEYLSEDMRLIKYEFIKVTEKLKPGAYIDVRISFANGADFILLSKKRVEDMSISSDENSLKALWLKVTEEELLRVSSAVVDSYLNNGCSIYAIEYLAKEQKQAIVNYPVNQVVENLIKEDPNIITKAKNVLTSSMRSEIERGSKPYNESESIQGEGHVTVDEENTEEPYTNDEIEYLD